MDFVHLLPLSYPSDSQDPCKFVKHTLLEAQDDRVLRILVNCKVFRVFLATMDGSFWWETGSQVSAAIAIDVVGDPVAIRMVCLQVCNAVVIRLDYVAGTVSVGEIVSVFH